MAWNVGVQKGEITSVGVQLGGEGTVGRDRGARPIQAEGGLRPDNPTRCVARRSVLLLAPVYTAASRLNSDDWRGWG